MFSREAGGRASGSGGAAAAGGGREGKDPSPLPGPKSNHNDGERGRREEGRGKMSREERGEEGGEVDFLFFPPLFFGDCGKRMWRGLFRWRARSFSPTDSPAYFSLFAKV